MSGFAISSQLAISPARFWELHAGNARAAASAGAAEWPRSVSFATRSLLVRAEYRLRTVSAVGSGCEVEDRVTLEPRFRLLAPWVKSLRVLAHVRVHRELRERYRVELPAGAGQP